MEWVAWSVVTVALCWYQLWSRRSVAHLVFCCELARLAYRDGTFVWDATVRGWTLTDIPKRRMTHLAQYYASERGTYADHSGEPFRFDLCPWCAGSLPYGYAMLTDGDSTED